MDYGHYNCRDYYISPHFAPTTITNDHRSPRFRHESWDELERRARSPASFKPKFPLLRLPLELRQQVLSYLLPRTRELQESTSLAHHARNFSAVKKREANGMLLPKPDTVKSANPNNIVWQKGNTSVMSVCRQLHDECAELVYGINTFLLFVTYSGVTFRFRWLLSSGYAPIRSYDFLGLMAERYQRLVKRVVINVDHVDSYTGMIKFNVQGKGLTHGLRRQLERLVKVLKVRDQPRDGGEKHVDNKSRLTKISIRVSNGNARVAEDLEEMLEPFEQLYGVREVSISGAVTDSYARALEDRMRSTQYPLRSDHSHHASDDGLASALGARLCVYGNDI